MDPTEKAAWLDARCGKLTASRMADAMAFNKKGEPLEKRSQYMRELLAERITGDSMPHFVNQAMQWGLDHEDEAVEYFVSRTGGRRVPLFSRFYEHPTIANFGATPDRELEPKGGLEIKCPTTATFIEWSLAGPGVVPEQHKPQMAAQILCTGWDWIGFIAYDPRIREHNKRMLMAKYVPTPAYLAEVEAAAVKFLDELDAMFNQFVSRP